jgi:tetratricopeptide (TPR) repeat protein
MNDLAWMVRQENPSEALEYAERAATLWPKSALVLDTLAMVLLEKGQYERAVSVASRARELAPNAPDLSYHLALIQERSGLTAEAAATLKQLLLEHREFGERKEAEALLKKLTVLEESPSPVGNETDALSR